MHTLQEYMRFRSNSPIIRIAAIELRNFKSVGHGKVCFLSDAIEAPSGTYADILAAYGQNGSGKTALIQAVALLRWLVSGQTKIANDFVDCIDVAADCAQLTYTFSMQYPDGGAWPADVGDALTVFYTVQLVRDGGADEENTGVYKSRELLQANGTVHGKSLGLQTLLDVPGPLLQNGNLNRPTRLGWYARDLWPYWSDSPYWEMMVDLMTYCAFYLIVVDTVSDGIVRQNLELPVFAGALTWTIPMNDAFEADDKKRSSVEVYLANVSQVMQEVVPGLKVRLHDHGSKIDKEGNPVHQLSLVSVRGTRELPLRCESDGVRHLLSVMWTLTWAYNDPHVTLAVDELDAGVFEFLLGELLQVFKDGGRGQLIFTAHNLRPLEVLDNDSILFTTTDPEDRYRKLTGLGEGENLRRAYYREILLHEHFDDLYAPTKRHRIAMAMARAAEPDTDSSEEEGR